MTASRMGSPVKPGVYRPIPVPLNAGVRYGLWSPEGSSGHTAAAIGGSIAG